MKDKLIGNIQLIGGMGCGKSAVAKTLEKHFGYKVFSYAKEVKKVASLLTDGESDNNKAKHRTLLQDIGRILKLREFTLNETEKDIIAEWQKNDKFFHYFYHNKSSMFSPLFYYETLMKDPEFQEYFVIGKVVIDDTRFVLENEMFKRESSIFDNISIHIDCPEHVRINRLTSRDGLFNPEWLKNVSETEWKQIKTDFHILNYGNAVDDPEQLRYLDQDHLIKQLRSIVKSGVEEKELEAEIKGDGVIFNKTINITPQVQKELNRIYNNDLIH